MILSLKAGSSPVHAPTDSAGEPQIQKVVWTLAGGKVAYLQQYSTAVGSTEYYADGATITNTYIDGSTGQPATVSSASLAAKGKSLYWDSTVADRTISATVTYADNTDHGTKVTVKLEQPGVAQLQMTPTPLVFGAQTVNGVSALGFYQAEPGDNFSATVTTKTEGGKFAWLQTINATLGVKRKNSGTATEVTPGTVLDNAPSQAMFLGAGANDMPAGRSAPRDLRVLHGGEG